MNWLAKIAAAVVYSNTWVSAGAALLTAQTFRIVDEPVNFGLVAFVFFSTLATYNFQRLIRFNIWGYRTNIRRVHWIRHSRMNLILLVATSLVLAAVLAISNLQKEHFLVLIPLAVISFFYAYPVLATSNRSLALRDLPGLKIIWIAGTWSIVTVVIPLISTSVIISESAWMAAERFCFIVAITIPFDVRDLEFDQPRQKTIPQLLGVRGAGWLSLVFLLVFTLLIWINHVVGNYSIAAATVLSANALITAIVLRLSFTKRKEPFYSGLIDGLTLLQPLMVFLWLH